MSPRDGNQEGFLELCSKETGREYVKCLLCARYIHIRGSYFVSVPQQSCDVGILDSENEDQKSSHLPKITGSYLSAGLGCSPPSQSVRLLKWQNFGNTSRKRKAVPSLGEEEQRDGLGKEVLNQLTLEPGLPTLKITREKQSPRFADKYIYI